MWTLFITHNFLISFWKLDKYVKDLILADIDDIYRNAEIIDLLENVEIIDEYDNSVVVPEHTVNYVVKQKEEEVYIISINNKGIKQKLSGYRI